MTDTNDQTEPREDATPDAATPRDAATWGDTAPDEAASAPAAAVAEAPAPARRMRIVAVVGAIVLLAILAFGAWFFLSGANDDFFDTNAKSGQAPYKSKEEMQAELDRVVEEGMFNISIASVIQFEDGSSPGTAYIENVPGNRYFMQVSIVLDDTDEEVFQSKALKPDSYLETIELTQDLEAGNHQATATFTAFDPDTREQAGQAAAKVTLAVAA